MEQHTGNGLTPEERRRAIELIAEAERNQQCGTSKGLDLSKTVGLNSSKDIRSEPIFLNPTTIKVIKRDYSQILPSGIHQIDKRIMGFNKGELSIWSGSNGSGKSSILSQLAIEGVENNFKVALFSGELRAFRVLNWIQLQCAGKKNVKNTPHENYYVVADPIKERINKWLDDKLYIYNNDYGMNAEKVLSAIKDLGDKKQISMAIIDNLMALNLSAVKGEKYEQQTNLLLALSALAKEKNIHIHFVAHPRKSISFLRKEDISGTADITNLADNVFIVHRVNTDFKKNIMGYLGFKDTHPILNFDNVIEICKNRDLGISDELVGLYFEKESKRFLNVRDEERNYSWETDDDGFITTQTDELPFD